MSFLNNIGTKLLRFTSRHGSRCFTACDCQCCPFWCFNVRSDVFRL